jgi:hypothetical protein
MAIIHVLAASAALVGSHFASAGSPPQAAPKAPCFTPYSYTPDLETMCSTTVLQSGNVTVRDYATAPGVFGAVTPTVASTPSTDTNFTTGSVQATGLTIDYFLYGNSAFDKIPLTTPLIFRPDPTGTWLASFALPPSSFPDPSKVPQPTINTASTVLEPFSNKRIAAYLFYSIFLATQAQYATACASLSAWIKTNGLQVVSGEWEVAWVTYSTEGEVGLRTNECWMEVAAPGARA